MPGAREHLERLAAHPRPAGSPAERAAGEWCRAALADAGFAVAAEPFSYSSIPGRVATPALGLAGMAVICTAARLAMDGHAWGAALLLILAGAGVGVIAAWFARVAVTRLPWGRRDGINLVATRGQTPPALWLTAHLDSKSQPVPILVRAAGITALLVIWAGALVMAVAQGVLGGSQGLWPWLAAAALVAGIPVAASVVGARSAGALDDASGVATVLRTAELADPGLPLGILLTSAEELGLAGARAWVRTRDTTPARAINVDGIDDTGHVNVTYTGRRPETLIAQLESPGEALRVSRLFPGVLVDSVALTDGGWHAVTVSKGTWRTVARIHTAKDNLSALTGDGVESVARWLSVVIPRAARTVET